MTLQNYEVERLIGDNVHLKDGKELQKQLWVLSLVITNKIFPKYSKSLSYDDSLKGEVVERCYNGLNKYVKLGKIRTFVDARRYARVIVANGFIDQIRAKKRHRDISFETSENEDIIDIPREGTPLFPMSTGNVIENEELLSFEERLTTLNVLIRRAFEAESATAAKIFEFMSDSANMEIVAHSSKSTKTSFNKAKLMAELGLSRDEVDKHYRVIAHLIKNKKYIRAILRGEVSAGWYKMHSRRIR